MSFIFLVGVCFMLLPCIDKKKQSGGVQVELRQGLVI